MELMHEFFVLVKDINPIVMTIAWTAILIVAGYDWLSGGKFIERMSLSDVFNRFIPIVGTVILISSFIYPLCHFFVK